MDDDPPLDFAVGKPPIDPDRVECDGCGAIEPIERMARINLTDRTPQRIMGVGTVAVQHYCPACFGRMFGSSAPPSLVEPPDLTAPRTRAAQSFPRISGETTVAKLDGKQIDSYSVILADVSTAIVSDPDGRFTWEAAREEILAYLNDMEDTVDRLRPILEEARDFKEYTARAGD